MLVQNKLKRFPDVKVDIDSELQKYQTFAELLKPMVVDSITFIHDAIQQDKRVLVEGANALLLDIDFGTFPFVTSSNTGIGGVLTGLGIPPKHISKTVGVTKAYCTRVGSGPFPTELLDEKGERLQIQGREWGTTTGRKRRCGWLDIKALTYSCKINGYDSLNLTKLDVLSGFDEVKLGTKYLYQGQELLGFPADVNVLQDVVVGYEILEGWKEDISGCRKFEELPSQAQKYVRRVEELTGVRVEWIGVGPGREAMIFM